MSKCVCVCVLGGVGVGWNGFEMCRSWEMVLQGKEMIELGQ